MSCAGRCGRGYFCAPRNSYGRKAIPFTKTKRKLARKQNKCSMCTKRLCAIIWPFRFLAGKNRKANGFRERCRHCPSKRWRRTEKRFKPARRIFLGKILRAPAVFNFRIAKGNRNLDGQPAG